MEMKKLFENGRTVFSMEIFPPKKPGTIESIYSTLDGLSDIKPDFIILDEFHRCGAEMWGHGVERLLSAYHGTPILGLSATAIRYLDNQRNMTDEFFDGNIASEISLGEAIVRGIERVHSIQQGLHLAGAARAKASHAHANLAAKIPNAH